MMNLMVKVNVKMMRTMKVYVDGIMMWDKTGFGAWPTACAWYQVGPACVIIIIIIIIVIITIIIWPTTCAWYQDRGNVLLVEVMMKWTGVISFFSIWLLFMWEGFHVVIQRDRVSNLGWGQVLSLRVGEILKVGEVSTRVKEITIRIVEITTTNMSIGVQFPPEPKTISIHLPPQASLVLFPVNQRNTTLNAILAK